MSAASGAALAVSIDASAQAHRARELACRGFMRGFSDAGATDADRREYARCVSDLLPGGGLPPEAETILRLVVATLLVGAVIGAFLEYREKRYFGFRAQWGDIAIAGFAGFVLAFGAWGGVLVVGLAVAFVVGGSRG